MLVKNGTAFIDGGFVRADVRVEAGKIAEIGELSAGRVKRFATRQGCSFCRALSISISTPTRARTACAARRTCAG